MTIKTSTFAAQDPSDTSVSCHCDVVGKHDALVSIRSYGQRNFGYRMLVLLHLRLLVARPHSILQDDVKGVDDTRNVTKDGQEDVDQEIRIAAALEEDTNRRDDDRKYDLDDVASSERHFGVGWRLLKLCVMVWLLMLVAKFG